MTDLQLYCLSDFKIGLFGSLYFVGFAISGILLKQADQFGRKKVILFWNFIQFFCCISLIFWTELYAKYATIFIWGLTACKYIAIYILCTELSPKKYQVYIGSFVLSLGVLSSQVPASIYLLSGGEDIQNVLIFSIILSFIATAVSCIVPESPRYLYERKLFTQLRENLESISRINGANMNENYLFEDENSQTLVKDKLSTKSKWFIDNSTFVLNNNLITDRKSCHEWMKSDTIIIEWSDELTWRWRVFGIDWT